MSETPQPDPIDAIEAAARARRNADADADIDADAPRIPSPSERKEPQLPDFLRNLRPRDPNPTIPAQSQINPVTPPDTNLDWTPDDNFEPDASNTDNDEWQKRSDLENAQPPQAPNASSAKGPRFKFPHIPRPKFSNPFSRKDADPFAPINSSIQEDENPAPRYENESTRRAAEETKAQIAAMGSTVLEDEVSETTGQPLTEAQRLNIRDKFDRVMHQRLPRILGGTTIGEYLSSQVDIAKAIPGAMLKTATSPKELFKMISVGAVTSLLKTGARLGISQLGMFGSAGLTVGAAAGVAGLYSFGREIHKQFVTERRGARNTKWEEARANHRNIITASWSYADKQRIGKAALRGAIKGAIGSAIGFEISDLGLLDSAGQFIVDRTSGVGETIKHALAPSPDTIIPKPSLNNETIPTRSPVPSTTEVPAQSTVVYSETPVATSTPTTEATTQPTQTVSAIFTETPPEPSSTAIPEPAKPIPAATPEQALAEAQTQLAQEQSARQAAEAAKKAAEEASASKDATIEDLRNQLAEAKKLATSQRLEAITGVPAGVDQLPTASELQHVSGIIPTEATTGAAEAAKTAAAVASEFNIPEGIIPENGIIELPAGSNPWDQASSIGKKILGRPLTNQETLLLTQELSRQSGITVPEWQIQGTIDAQNLPPGFQLKFNDNVIDVLKKFKK